MTYAYLALGIAAEVMATSFMKLSDGFSRPAPSVITIIGYAVALYFLSLALRALPTGVVYAIWSGAGIVLIALVAWIFHDQKLDLAAVAGMGLIIAGVAVMHLFSHTAAH